MQETVYRVDHRMIPPVMLGMGLGIVLLMLEGPSQKGAVLLLALSPFFYLGIEILARSVRLDSGGVTVFKFLRSVRLEWSEIESFDAVRTGSKLFLILQGKPSRPVLITNTISPFAELAGRLLDLVPPERIAHGTRELIADAPAKYGPLIQAWLFCLVLGAIVVGRTLGYG